MNGLRRFVDTPTASPGAPVGTSDDAPVRDHGAPEILRRFVGSRPRPKPGEACELCATPIGDDHRHVVDVRTQSLRCSCRGCALLFDGAAMSGRYRAVPDRYLRLRPFVLEAHQWTALQIPVGMAFFMVSTPMDTTVAFYPSPAGATESELPLDTWAEIVTANPALADLVPDVEAVLIRAVTAAGPGSAAGVAMSGASEPDCYVAPIDRCYELVGELRLHWHGFDGGSEVRHRIKAFFSDLADRSRTVGIGDE